MAGNPSPKPLNPKPNGPSSSCLAVEAKLRQTPNARFPYLPGSRGELKVYFWDYIRLIGPPKKGYRLPTLRLNFPRSVPSWSDHHPYVGVLEFRTRVGMSGLGQYDKAHLWVLRPWFDRCRGRHAASTQRAEGPSMNKPRTTKPSPPDLKLSPGTSKQACTVGTPGKVSTPSG